MESRFHIFKQKILKMSDILEIVIALFLVIMTLALTIKFIYMVALEGPAAWGEETIHKIVQDAFNLIIAIEFVQMLLKHSVGSVLEVVLFSVARGMIVDHNGGLQTLLIVIAIGLVLFIRKNLLLPHDLNESMDEVDIEQSQKYTDKDEPPFMEAGESK